jgi:hypothetical protein
MPVWAAITTAKRQNKAFFESNTDHIVDLVSEAIKSNHPGASQLSKAHTEAWQRHTTQALGTDATLLSPTPAISIVFCDPSNKFNNVDSAHKNRHVVSRLVSVNTSPFARRRKDKPAQSSASSQWIMPSNRSINRAIGTNRGDESSSRARSSGRFSSMNSGLLAWRPVEVDDDGYMRDEED